MMHTFFIQERRSFEDRVFQELKEIKEKINTIEYNFDEKIENLENTFNPTMSLIKENSKIEDCGNLM